MTNDSLHQFPLVLTEHPTDEILHERLAAVVEQFNASTDPAERVELHREMERLRRVLSPPRKVGPQSG